MTSKAFELARLGNAYSDGALSNRNLIINGAMQVAQRGTAAVNATTSAGYGSVDRWKTDIDGSHGHNWSHEQSTDAPTGFLNSSKITVVTNGSQPSSDAAHQFYQIIESQDVRNLGWGASGAKAVTLSFWVKGSVSGVYGIKLNYYGSSGSLSYNTSYSIDSANTWEYKTITLTGPTTGGSSSTLNGNGLLIEFVLGLDTADENNNFQTWQGDPSSVPSGAVYLPATSGATWLLTGVQLEVGDTATPFEHRSYGDELAKCQRYCQLYGEDTTVAGVVYTNDKDHYYPFRFPEMRAVPSVTFSSQPTVFANDTNGANTVTAGGANNDNRRSIRFQAQNISIGSAGQASWFQMGAAGSYFLLEAEL